MVIAGALTLAGLGGGGDGERLGKRGEEHPRGGRSRQAGTEEQHHQQQRQRDGTALPSHRSFGLQVGDEGEEPDLL